jgi:hypothetical protein
MECNVYLGPSAAMLKEEDLVILTMCSEQAATQTTPRQPSTSCLLSETGHCGTRNTRPGPKGARLILRFSVSRTVQPDFGDLSTSNPSDLFISRSLSSILLTQHLFSLVPDCHLPTKYHCQTELHTTLDSVWTHLSATSPKWAQLNRIFVYVL